MLAIAVAATLLVLGGLFTIDRLRGKFVDKNDRLAELEQTISTQELTVLRGAKADRKLKEWRSRSLPEDRTLAKSLYLNWLRERAVAVKLSQIKVSPGSFRPVGDVYSRHSFTVSGQGDLRQLTQFLYDFYRVGYLHRISNLQANPIPKSKLLDMSITIEALSLTGAPNGETLDDPPAERLARQDIEEYFDVILARNLFSPANKPPSVASMGTQTGHPEKAMSFRFRASDPESDELSYSFDGDVPEGATIESGEFRWTPTELGEFEIAYRVTDNGIPAKSAAGKVKLAIVEPPPPVEKKPGFDPATTAKVSAITASGDLPEVWISVLTEGKVLRLRVGDEIAVGTVKGKIAKIMVREKAAEIAMADGETLVIALGKSLADAAETDLGGI
jgi:hypothetical protein